MTSARCKYYLCISADLNLLSLQLSIQPTNHPSIQPSLYKIQNARLYLRDRYIMYNFMSVMKALWDASMPAVCLHKADKTNKPATFVQELSAHSSAKHGKIYTQ